MGLDQYCFATRAKIPATDFEKPIDGHDFHYWRKHPNLQGWMEQLYYSKGGKSEEFNCVPVKIEATDLTKLERAIRADDLPRTTGFFFGTSRPDFATADLEFIAKARALMQAGFTIFYISWW